MPSGRGTPGCAAEPFASARAGGRRADTMPKVPYDGRCGGARGRRRRHRRRARAVRAWRARGVPRGPSRLDLALVEAGHRRSHTAFLGRNAGDRGRPRRPDLPHARRTSARSGFASWDLRGGSASASRPPGARRTLTRIIVGARGESTWPRSTRAATGHGRRRPMWARTEAARAHVLLHRPDEERPPPASQRPCPERTRRSGGRTGGSGR